MNIHYIQTQLFRELVDMEVLLKPEYAIKIDKYTSGNMSVSVWGDKEQRFILGRRIFTDSIETPAQITAEINRIWDAIPAECKRDDILK
jgi:hypothetical protein